MKKIFLVLLILGVISGKPAQAAVSGPIAQVMVSGAYGLAGGAFIGGASYAVTHGWRSLALGSSIGFLLGVVYGGVSLLDRSPEARWETHASDFKFDLELDSRGVALKVTPFRF